MLILGVLAASMVVGGAIVCWLELRRGAQGPCCPRCWAPFTETLRPGLPPMPDGTLICQDHGRIPAEEAVRTSGPASPLLLLLAAGDVVFGVFFLALVAVGSHA